MSGLAVEQELAGALYLPICAAVITGVLRPRKPKRFAACLLSALWVAVMLIVLQRMNTAEHWWTFVAYGSSSMIPVELYFGWVALWGVLPELLFVRLDLVWVAAIMGLVDIVGMPLLSDVVRLNDAWLAGEAIAILLVLFPALFLGRWTQYDRRLGLRATLQVALSGTLFLFFVPELVFFCTGGGWRPLLRMSSAERQIVLQSIALLALPGVAAVMEFVQRGRGSPIPFDPPKRLVVSGIYRYIANPMQLSCVLVMLAWSAVLQSAWLAAGAVVAIVYGAGIASWDERADLEKRFGETWREYRRAVRNWIPRWRPYVPGAPSRLYIARTCSQCSELRRWLERRNPVGLEFADAESLPEGSIRRVRYDVGDGSEAVEGVRALGRALEHIHLAWALAGAALRIPGVWQAVQLVMDASGLGPRVVDCDLAETSGAR